MVGARDRVAGGPSDSLRLQSTGVFGQFGSTDWKSTPTAATVPAAGLIAATTWTSSESGMLTRHRPNELCVHGCPACLRLAVPADGGNCSSAGSESRCRSAAVVVFAESRCRSSTSWQRSLNLLRSSTAMTSPWLLLGGSPTDGRTSRWAVASFSKDSPDEDQCRQPVVPG